MSGVFYDTNVVLYAARPELDPRDAPKRPIAVDLMDRDDFFISGQVLAEFYHNAVNKGPHRMAPDEARAWIERLAEQPCAAVDAGLVKAGADLAARYRISYWDGAILAAAHDLGATTLYTEGLNDGQRYGDVTAINPFKSVSH